MNPPILTCDYLVIGAGAASLAFIDTLLTEMPSTKIILVDKNVAPGGHWVHDYDYITLHHPSIVYGLSSKQLEGNWLKCIFGKRLLPWKHQATKKEIVKYFQDFVDEKVASGQIDYYPGCEYNITGQKIHVENSDSADKQKHTFSSLDGKTQYIVQVREKLVNGILGECLIPSQCPVQFEVHANINMITPNQLYDSHQVQVATKERGPKIQYVVLGYGKTAMDAVVYMLKEMKVIRDDISWIIPNDVWMLNREGGGGPWSYSKALLAADGDLERACTDLEARGIIVRMDKDITPTRFRFPVIGKDELTYMRKVKNIIRRGRVTSITSDDDGAIKVNFGNDHEPWVLPPSDQKRVFIHCTCPGPFNPDREWNNETFVSDSEMRLLALYVPPISISLSVLAKVESARRRGTLDIDFGIKLLRAKSLLQNGDSKIPTDNDILRQLIIGTKLNGEDSDHLVSLPNLALFLALVDTDPMVGYNWMKSNRLSFFSIPGFKSGIVNSMGRLAKDGKKLGLAESDIIMCELLQEKLLPLKDL